MCVCVCVCVCVCIKDRYQFKLNNLITTYTLKLISDAHHMFVNRLIFLWFGGTFYFFSFIIRNAYSEQ